MATSDAQKSEEHERTGDASTSPAAEGDAKASPNMGRQQGRAKSIDAPKHHGRKRDLPGLGDSTHITRDDTDVGGPLVVESSDPDLKNPQVPIDPFPTERKPEIDPPVSNDKTR